MSLQSVAAVSIFPSNWAGQRPPRPPRSSVHASPSRKRCAPKPRAKLDSKGMMKCWEDGISCSFDQTSYIGYAKAADLLKMDQDVYIKRK